MDPQETANQRKQLQNLLGRAAMAFDEQNDGNARRLYEQGMDLIESYQLDNYPEAMVCMRNLATIYYADGRLEQALDVYSRLVMASGTQLGESNREVIGNMFMLAKICDELEQEEDASSLYTRVLKLADKHVARDDILYRHIKEAYAQRNTGQKQLRQTVSQTDTSSMGIKAVTGALTGQSDDGPSRREVLKRHQVLISGVVSVVAVVLLFFWLQWLSVDWNLAPKLPEVPVTKAPDAGGLNKVKNPADASAFRTADGAVKLVFDDKSHARLLYDQQELPFQFQPIGANFDGVGVLISGMFARKVCWMEVTPRGMMIGDNVLLFNSDAPEVKVVEQMEQMARILEMRYATRISYPSKIAQWKADYSMVRTNPIDGKSEHPSLQIFSKYQITFGEASSDSEFPRCLSEGQRWADEPVAVPGGINCFAVYSGEKVGEEFPTHQFYAHGYDRNGQLIPASEKGQYHFIALINGKDFDSKSLKPKGTRPSLVNTVAGAQVYMVNQGDMLLGVIPLNYIAPAFLGGLALISVFSFLTLDLRRRLNDVKRLPTVTEVATVITVILWIAWCAMRLLP